MTQEQARCIAHEIRNHISICELYTKIIEKNLEKDGIENPSITNALNCITKSLKIMGNSLLDLKSLGNLSPKVCNISEILQEAIELSKVYIQEKQIEINYKSTDEALVFIDENKFLACLVNIIKNAIEAIENKGKIEVSLTFNPTKNCAIVKISNNGTQIPKDKQQTIFEKGFTTKKTGSGLGLHICAQDLMAQNSKIQLNCSTPEQTVFEITVPIYKN
jgi:signal transduction histidine kinase